MVTFGATCLYWLTSSWSVPPWVPGSVPFMPCQKVMLTGAALAAAVGLAVATGALVAETAMLGPLPEMAPAVAPFVAATADVVGAFAGAVAAGLAALAAADVGADVAPGAGLEHATTEIDINTGIAFRKRIQILRSALQPTASNAFQKVPLHQDEHHHHRSDRERARRHQRVIVRAVFEREGRQPDLDRSHVRSTRHHQRPQEALPTLHERVQRHGEQRRR